jgi:predicted short-subunit dehydrogenase-like oxidoreductase (DUF2520 family)
MGNHPFPLRCAVVGRGRMGAALSARLNLDAPLGRGADASGAEVVLLAVPDAEIAAAARAVAPGPLVGHLSGATTLAPLAPHEAFSLHPLMTVTGPDTSGGASRSGQRRPDEAARHHGRWPDAGAVHPFQGAGAAIAGSTPRALATARALAEHLGLRAIEVADADRAAYHAAASIAANFLVALESAAERLAATTGLDRAALAPLARAALDNWAALGGERALTGPIARGDAETVARQRAAVAERCPELLEAWDALASLTRDLAGVPA